MSNNRRRSKNGGGSNSQSSQTALSAAKYGEMFQEYKKELDASHDRHERLVKLSRDCTIHSKRAIFTMHHFAGEEETKEKILEEAEAKFTTVIHPILRNICKEIGAEDPYRYHRAYSPGLQEFIEALAYYKYLKSGRLILFKEAQKFLTFQPKKNEPEGVEKSDSPKETAKEEESSDNVALFPLNTTEGTGAKLYLIPSDFVLGLADLTGELMRLSINAVGSGNREFPFLLLPFFRALFCGFHSFGPGVKNMKQKMSVLRSSLGKVERVCYTLKVRGSEIPKQMLMNAINTTTQANHHEHNHHEAEENDSV